MTTSRAETSTKQEQTPLDRQRKIEGAIFFVLFAFSIWLANYFITHVGIQFDPNGPHTIPVWPWPVIYAPSGVLVIGLSFTLRDLVQRRLGTMFSALAVVIGAVLSAFLSPALALASGGAFLISELMDLGVYTPLRKKNIYVATFASNAVGLIVDSAVFLFLAFGSLQFLIGQVIGKLWMTLIFLPVIAAIERWDKKRGMPHA